ncbi:MAG: bifunctional 5,10-methylene-tetrahydrofolate dehydrogenase/ 5,10-methylene-tetrahydrofolate cyclohydrolase [Candidatus Jorgensenbacteria bacterium GW2011_GWA1_48_11]|uniref:Bifunctional 5,10-methylene-tetrahydrofolate dehydrogenase/ 5,10-methylene-tetrahydrofolate cyclohydrolase n=1 Tax=Candidatus Jorgensenbacteria bacterium GW2011_GWA1_48_11 TaxID=1618660 RepID=A0A0G1XBE9_9BACT|nr:MAG: bifunctional 5,10-methylene-tetrahydrofolate dehydrogenase/ 5,10-methylene-tetrahydrofolate cyclohydrolase [Candidatus Jorgensenbacteria bacterium GW2011_GWA1_48_11]KKW12112.1 MAG: bifunctional 5,10-methylene-tetrahydrofolate dehydrogenase/ 5,10-methylene-tetrahydrofolate cyclohydrolase [Candidatus Jorgensenbacteria bacterium GW2011_GWB1_49_9]
MVIDGKKIALDIIADLKKQPKPKRFLAVFLVGNEASSVSFVKQKRKIAGELGVDFRLYEFPESLKQDELRKEVLKIASQKICGGVIVQLPLPEHINKHSILNVIPREKDIDVLGERALGAFYADRNPVLPPAVGAVEEIIRNLKLEIRNSSIAIVGLGLLIGKPTANWIMSRARTVFLLGRDSDLKILKEADVVICGAGQARLIEPKMLKPMATVIDFGYGMLDGKISGDFNSASLETGNAESGISYTPTPGGTGPILVTQIFVNFYALNKD